jgi:hypothetical protein
MQGTFGTTAPKGKRTGSRDSSLNLSSALLSLVAQSAPAGAATILGPAARKNRESIRAGPALSQVLEVLGPGVLARGEEADPR